MYNWNYLHFLESDSRQAGQTAAILCNGYCCLNARFARALCVRDLQCVIKVCDATSCVCAMFSTDCQRGIAFIRVTLKHISVSQDFD